MEFPWTGNRSIVKINRWEFHGGESRCGPIEKPRSNNPQGPQDGEGGVVNLEIFTPTYNKIVKCTLIYFLYIFDIVFIFNFTPTLKQAVF